MPRPVKEDDATDYAAACHRIGLADDFDHFVARQTTLLTTHRQLLAEHEKLLAEMEVRSGSFCKEDGLQQSHKAEQGAATTPDMQVATVAEPICTNNGHVGNHPNILSNRLNEAKSPAKSDAFLIHSAYTTLSQQVYMEDVGDAENDKERNEFIQATEEPRILGMQNWWIMSPNSNQRLAWDLLGVAVLLYDVVTLPLTMAFGLSQVPALNYAGYISLLYWTLDFPASFCVGYMHGDGSLVLDASKIARHYAKAWMPSDMLIVGLDWTITIVDISSAASNEQGTQMPPAGKMLRVLRILRVLRLLRVAKLQDLANKVTDRISSQRTLLLLGVLKHLIFVLFANHYVACGWYAVGSNPSAGQLGWVAIRESRGPSMDFVGKYGVCLHWSLTQFTPASMDVHATTELERYYSILVLLFAMVVFSSFVGAITGAMNEIRALSTANSKQLYVLRRYLRQKNIRLELQIRITRFLNQVLIKNDGRIHSKDVALFKHLSHPLHSELVMHLHKPLLVIHPIFTSIGNLSEAMMERFCSTATTTLALARGDILFSEGEEGRSMYMVIAGDLIYAHMERKLRPNLSLLTVEAKQRVSEAVLWTHWIHRGRLRAKHECDILGIDFGHFLEVALEFPSFIKFFRNYGEQYLIGLAKSAQELGLVTDLQHDVSLRPEVTHALSRTSRFQT